MYDKLFISVGQIKKYIKGYPRHFMNCLSIHQSNGDDIGGIGLMYGDGC